MVFSEHHVALTRNAHEHHVRPSIDKLFRSAAVTHGSRVIGVLLTGMLDDGVAGLRDIRAAGGVVIVQDPQDAAFPELPARALQTMSPDHVLPIEAIPPALIALVDDGRVSVPLDQQPSAQSEQLAELGTQNPVSCPDCKGPTWEIGDERSRRYRCYLGHVTNARELLAHGSIEIEAALWSAIRALNDRASTLETLAQDARNAGSGEIADSYAIRGREARLQADLARQFMYDLLRPS
jgi:two-component system chemotaxis response regulator CheB